MIPVYQSPHQRNKCKIEIQEDVNEVKKINPGKPRASKINMLIKGSNRKIDSGPVRFERTAESPRKIIDNAKEKAVLMVNIAGPSRMRSDRQDS